MPDTRTVRMAAIADAVESDGLYTSAASIHAITEERDRLRQALMEAVGAWGDHINNGREISGADMVEWYCVWRERVLAECGAIFATYE